MQVIQVVHNEFNLHLVRQFEAESRERGRPRPQHWVA